MSYDYHLFKAAKAVRSFDELEEDQIAPLGTWEDVKALLAHVRPDLEWNDHKRFGALESANERLTFSCYEDGPIYRYITAAVWWPSDIKERLVTFATTLGLFVVDPQSGAIVGGKVTP